MQLSQTACPSRPNCLFQGSGCLGSPGNQLPNGDVQNAALLPEVSGILLLLPFAPQPLLRGMGKEEVVLSFPPEVLEIMKSDRAEERGENLYKGQ